MEVGQYGFSIVIGTVLMMLIFPEVPATFAALMPSGFSGGFAYAASIGGTITEMTGWQDAAAIAQTFSTIGLLLGVFGGILLINIYCRRGATRFVSDVKDIPQELKTGFLEEDSREVIGEQTTSAMHQPTAQYMSLAHTLITTNIAVQPKEEVLIVIDAETDFQLAMALAHEVELAGGEFTISLMPVRGPDFATTTTAVIAKSAEACDVIISLTRNNSCAVFDARVCRLIGEKNCVMSLCHCVIQNPS